MLTFDGLRTEEIVGHGLDTSLQPSRLGDHALLILQDQHPGQVRVIAAYLNKIMTFTTRYVNHEHRIVRFLGIPDQPLIEGIKLRVTQ